MKRKNTMKCTEVKQNLDAFFDGKIVSTQTEFMETHLENCNSCQTELENLQSVRNALKQNLAISAPAFLDEKVMNAFQKFHEEKRTKENPEKLQKEKMGWFRVPRFAFAAAFAMFALSVISAFQIGRMSAGEISVVTAEVIENESSKINETPPVKIVEVPAVVEKILIKVPVIE